MVALNKHDLEFILKQIKIAEAHANGTPLTEIRLDASGRVITDRAWYTSPSFDPTFLRAIPDPKTPFGLRTVDGSFNNIVEGRELWGAADQPMPRLLNPNFINENDDSMTLGGGQTVTNNNYGTVGSPTPGVNGGHSGNVADADPRLISNLVADMSFNNPAAIVAALTFAGSADVYGDLDVVRAAHATLISTIVAINADPALDEAAKQAARDAAQADFGAVLEAKGIEAVNGSIVIPNVAADEGLSAPFNSWMTFFGQFFDHGLDLITKTNNGTIYIPLAPDDPLRTHGPDGVPGTGDEVSAQNAFMVLSRATPVAGPGADGILGTADDTNHEAVNVTTPFVDQNQTYTSHASHQVFLREYATVNGRTVSTGHLLDGATGGLGTWGDVKAQAQTMLGIKLGDQDVFNVPLLRTDPYGRFIPDPVTGYAQVILGLGADGTPNTADDIVISGTAANPIDLLAMATTPVVINGVSYFGPIRTAHAFLDDIAHNAVPGSVFDADGDPATPGTLVVQADADNVAGNAIATDFRGRKVAYDDELLNAHFATGDGRGNENIGLTAVHHVFHSEHNRQVEAQKLTVLQSADLAFINEWLATDIAGLPSNFASLSALDQLAYANTLNWDGERLFQAARFATEMQYQHLVFEEFARQVQPLIDPFVFNSTTDINPAIFAEFAHTVYRFGHSMLTENIGLMDPTTGAQSEIGLIEAFLNPVAMNALGTADEATAAIVAGMTRVRGNEIDEFVTGALRNNLLGLPLDLPAINIARGRDAGIPSLNDARAQLYAATGSTFLEPYKNWVDFAANLKNPLSVVNFIAAYGTHASITGATNSADKRDAAWNLVFGAAGETAAEKAARIAWLNGPAATTGVNAIDLWIGGLAEKKMPFGGMLGSTFNAVFEAQMENLQDGDRFYYLTRTQGLNVLNQLEENAFAKMILKNTTLSDPGADGIRGTGDDIVDRHLGINVFANYDHFLEVNAAMQIGADPTGNDPVLEGLGRGKVQRDDPLTAAVETNFIRFTGGEHVSIGGTVGNDTIITDFGDDSVWGGSGNDRIESGAGVDLINGGEGDDIITDSGDSGDFLKGEGGDDVIANSNGIDVLMGGSGKDAVFVGVDDTEVFGGSGDDFILGGDAVDLLMGNEGDDWMEGGAGFDTLAGDNSELFFNSTIIGHDVMFAGSDEQDFDAESGDDIMVQGESVMRNEGMFGFDWVTFQGARIDGYADMRIKIFTTEEQDVLRNRFDKVEALSGWTGNDTLIGDDRVASLAEIPPGPVNPDIVAANEGVFFKDELSQAGVNRIDGLRELLSDLIDAAPAGATAAQLEALVAFNSGNILLGGAGSDRLQGNGGDDVLDGDNWLNARIRITGAGQDNTAANEIGTITSMKHVFGTGAGIPAAWQGKSLFQLMVDRIIAPSQLHIVREILDGGQAGDIDTAVFWDVRDNYDITRAEDGGFIITHVTQTAGVPLVSDGTDRLYNVERLQFADVTLDIVNTPATGVPVISDTTPTQNQLLTLDLTGISDAQGIDVASLTIQWQEQQPDSSWADIPGANTASFTPSAAQVNQALRAVVSFNDNLGYPEQAISASTSPVAVLNTPATGAPVISDTTPTQGQPLTLNLAAISDAQGINLASLAIQWQVQAPNGTWANIPGATTAGFTPGAAQVNQPLRAVVSFNDNAGNPEQVISASTTPVGLLFNGAGGADNVNGTLLGSDILNGAGGNDTLNGLGGDDLINGGAGADVLSGGDGNDTVNGGTGNDTVNGGNGADILNGEDGTDTINGDAGDDTINGGAANDTINGGAGDDTIVWNVGGGRDTINGGLEGLGGDTIVINGDATAETYHVWTRTAWVNFSLANT
ncbi:peroxidase family protein, partial [Brevundimonas sp.]|uniref:peroxidase family protein n=1 Tax=Brevundimonas sp. TaxID=1871086 RepID=UPI003D6C6FF4